MVANALIQARINKKTKEDAAHVLAAIGLTISDAIRLMLTRVATEHALPFTPVVPNSKTIAAMKELDSGKGKKFVSVDELMADLECE